jgi:histidyl-tRNA synthetase
VQVKWLASGEQEAIAQADLPTRADLLRQRLEQR